MNSSDQLVHLLGKPSGGGEKEGTVGNSTELRGEEKGGLVISLSPTIVFRVRVLFVPVTVLKSPHYYHKLEHMSHVFVFCNFQ